MPWKQPSEAAGLEADRLEVESLSPAETGPCYVMVDL